MARRGGSSLYVSTDPNVPVNVGIPGVSVFIGTPGPTIFRDGGDDEALAFAFDSANTLVFAYDSASTLVLAHQV